MDYEVLFPGRFLKGADLAGKESTAEIKSIAGEEIDGKFKAIISFVGAKKQFVCNRTNAEAIRLCLGRETNNWIGKRITLAGVVMKDPFGDGEICALRVVGSPEISQPLTAEVKRGRKTLNIKVRPTGAKPAAKGNGKVAGAAQAPAPSSTPAPAPASSEPTEEEKQAAIAAEFAQSEQDRPF
jgi:hypothetical protein